MRITASCERLLLLRIADCIIRRVIPQPTEWQHIGNQIDAALIFARADFVNVHRDGKRFVLRAEEKVTAFLRLEAAIRVTSVELCFL